MGVSAGKKRAAGASEGKTLKVVVLCVSLVGLVVVGVAAFFQLKGWGLCYRLDKDADIDTCADFDNATVLVLEEKLEGVGGEVGEAKQYWSCAYASVIGMSAVAALALLAAVLSAVWLCREGPARLLRCLLAALAFLGQGLLSSVTGVVALLASFHTLSFDHTYGHQSKTVHITINSYLVAGILTLVNGVLGFVQFFILMICASKAKSPVAGEEAPPEGSAAVLAAVGTEPDVPIVSAEEEPPPVEQAGLPPTPVSTVTAVAGTPTAPIHSVPLSPLSGPILAGPLSSLAASVSGRSTSDSSASAYSASVSDSASDYSATFSTSAYSRSEA